MMRLAIVTGLLLVFSGAPAAAQSTVFMVRHAERAETDGKSGAMMADDPDLSTAGRARAESLATLLKEAKITGIFTSEYKRTQQTAAPLAKTLGLEIIQVSSKDAAGLTKRVKSHTGNLLVVGHSNTIPELAKSLGVKETITIGDQDFDNLFLVFRTASPKVVRLHYK
jgi:phosphohistidine phosphatase SixA